MSKCVNQYQISEHEACLPRLYLVLCLLTHLVQQAVSVGEVEGLQAVGLTQEVVEMLNAK